MKQKYPFISVIIPTRDRPEQLVSCLQSLERQVYPPDRFEVIVVDDGGNIQLESLIDRFNYRIDMKLFKQKPAGPGKARNTGARSAKGQFLAFTDDDCIPATDWLENLAARFSSSADSVIGGPAFNTLTSNLYSCASQLINDFFCSYHHKDHNEVGFLASNNLAVPTDRFHAIGGFVSFPFAGGEDREFCDRWSNQGNRIIYDPKINIHHAHQLTLFTFLRQQFNYGRGSFLFHRLRAKRNLHSIRLQPISFYFKLLCYLFPKTQGLRMTNLIILISLSQLAVGAGFLLELLKINSKKLSDTFEETFLL